MENEFLSLSEKVRLAVRNVWLHHCHLHLLERSGLHCLMAKLWFALSINYIQEICQNILPAYVTATFSTKVSVINIDCIKCPFCFSSRFQLGKCIGLDNVLLLKGDAPQGYVITYFIEMEYSLVYFIDSMNYCKTTSELIPIHT